MNSQSVQATVLISAAALLGAGWGLARLHPFGMADGTGSAPRAELRLTGTWEAPDAVPVADPLVELDVPLNSWVTQGQFIGMTRTNVSPDPSAENEARLRLSDANDAVAEARRRVQAAEGEIATTDAVAADAESGLVQAENSAVATASAAADSRRRYRSGLESSLKQDEDLERQKANADKAQRLLEQAIVAGGNGGGPQAARSEARDKLRAALAEQQAARTALANVLRSAGVVPVQAPAEGFLVIRDENSGTYEIALKARPRVGVAVSEADLALVRRDQPATITCDAQLDAVFHGKVETIGQAREDDEGHMVYPVTLVVTDPGARLADDASVSVRIQTAAP